MSLDALRFPDYAKDIERNLTALATETVLSDQQRWGTFLACAHALGAPAMVRAVEAETEAKLTPEAKNAAKAAAAMMAMNNVYYRALHLMQNSEYRALRTGLRMNSIANPGVEKTDFELWSLAVSAINGCGACLDAHEEELKKRGASALQIQAALKIAAVMTAASAVLRAEAALSDQN